MQQKTWIVQTRDVGVERCRWSEDGNCCKVAKQLPLSGLGLGVTRSDRGSHKLSAADAASRGDKGDGEPFISAIKLAKSRRYPPKAQPLIRDAIPEFGRVLEVGLPAS